MIKCSIRKLVKIVKGIKLPKLRPPNEAAKLLSTSMAAYPTRRRRRWSASTT